MFGGHGFGEIPFGGGGVTSVAVRGALDLTTAYHLEVRSAAGTMLAAMTRDLTAARWTRELNRPDSMSATVPLSSLAAPYLKRPNRIYLYDSSRTLIQQFEVTRRRDSGVSEEHVTVEAQSLLWLASRARVRGYISGTKTVREIVEDFLAFQDPASPRVKLGSIDSSIANETRVVAFANERPTVMEALLHLRELVGGYLWVSKTGRLFWRRTMGRRVGQRLTRRRNMSGVTVEYDQGQLANRVYAYGANGLTLDVDDYPDGYMEDAASVAVYGVVEAVLEDNRIFSAATLEAAAERYLAEHAQPEYSISVRGANLGAWRGDDRAWEEFGLGDRVRVVDEVVTALAGDPLALEVEVVRVTTDLLQALTLDVELVRPALRWERVIADLLEGSDDEETPLADEVLAEVDIDGPGDAGTSRFGLRADARIPLNLDALAAALAADYLEVVNKWVPYDGE